MAIKMEPLARNSIFAPGMAAPAESVTVPETGLGCWALAVPWHRLSKNKIRKNAGRIDLRQEFTARKLNNSIRVVQPCT